MSTAHKKSNRGFIVAQQLRNPKGFTLLELLVVVALIAIIIGIAAASFTSAQKKTRNTKRQSDVQRIAIALEEYFNDHHKYPTGLSCLTGTDNACEVPNDKVYMDPVPGDPSSNAPYTYTPVTSAPAYQSYTLTANNEGFTYSITRPE